MAQSTSEKAAEAKIEYVNVDKELSNFDALLSQLRGDIRSNAASETPRGLPAARTNNPSSVDPPSADLFTDHVDNPLFETRTSHLVRIAPSTVVSGAGGRVNVNCVQDVPLRWASSADALVVNTPIHAIVANNDNAMVAFNNVTRAAAASARQAGDFPSSVTFAVGREGAMATEATIDGICTRITVARVAALQGATADPNPGHGPLDIAITDISMLSSALEACPNHVPVFVPSGLSVPATAALVSLLGHGGPGAYVWRYRTQGVGDAATMPACVRFSFPGGARKILVVVENGRQRQFYNTNFGGAALTSTALASLEAYYRKRWGNQPFTLAYRTTYALANVYLKPIPRPASRPSIHEGSGFTALQTTRIVQINGVNVNLGTNSDRDWQPGQGTLAPGCNNNRAVLAALGNRQLQHVYTAYLDWVRQQAPNRAFNPALPVYNGGPAPPPPQAHREHNAQGLVFTWSPEEDVDLIWIQPWEELWQYVGGIGSEVRIVFETISAEAVGCASGEVVEDPEVVAPPPLPEDTEIRNVYGAVDSSEVRLPTLVLESVLGLIAGVCRPTWYSNRFTTFSERTLRTRLKLAGAHLHLANFYNLASQNVFPADLDDLRLPHAAIVAMFDVAVRPKFFMTELSREHYDAQNYEVLECGFSAGRVNTRTPFAGFGVAGEWRVDAAGTVDTNASTTDFLALESAVRSDISNGLTINANMWAGQAAFSVVMTDNYVNPMPIAPRIRTARGGVGVALEAVYGHNSLAAGRANDSMIVSN